MKIYKLSIHKAMGGPRVDECRKNGDKLETKLETRENVNNTRREFRLERADALRWTTSELALGGSMQSSASAETGGLLSLLFGSGVSFSLA